MLAIGYKQASPDLHDEALSLVNIAKPAPAGRDLLVKISAISVNPVDTKIRRTAEPDADEFKILGWDAVGIVEAVGEHCEYFKPGDRVFYAGDISRPGTNAEFQLVDERIVGTAPAKLSDAEAAAMPLTALTAWELLFSRLQLPADASGKDQVLLIIGGAGGVGSILTQLARQLTELTIVSTASRPQTIAWAKEMGAHHVINHHQSLPQQLEEIGINQVDAVASLTHTDSHLDSLVEMLKPQGKLGLIDDPESLDVTALKKKSISLHWEFMYTRSLFNTEDMVEQHRILNRVAELLDNKTLKTTLGQHLGPVNVANLIQAHTILESNKACGKLVLEGFEQARG
ncbi:zinc-binding alcohol dehydrogenase family protein [Salinimonas chungwhensis]|uniref:zinc-binding alcohol dehydrogenase family protein n=1 Tax=Salinimonas chungwhensis TaxID=265425 RepID=UPI00035CF461|nr:zinc-binding alcohol dehydrogenase family protein [Salinimonas chungwhensis]